MRRVHDLVAFCAPYEFEDVVATVTDADRVEVLDFPAIEFARRVYKYGRKVLPSRKLARRSLHGCGFPGCHGTTSCSSRCSTIPSALRAGGGP
jgi:hypothetical protein